MERLSLFDGPVVVGLFITAALEQAVEGIYHRHQSEQLQEQMLGVFAYNVNVDEANLNPRSAIAARRHGSVQSALSAVSDTRMADVFWQNPSFTPYEAAAMALLL